MCWSSDISRKPVLQISTLELYGSPPTNISIGWTLEFGTFLEEAASHSSVRANAMIAHEWIQVSHNSLLQAVLLSIVVYAWCHGQQLRSYRAPKSHRILVFLSKKTLFWQQKLNSIDCSGQRQSLTDIKMSWNLVPVNYNAALLSFQNVCRIHFFSWMSEHDVTFYSQTLIGCPDHCKFCFCWRLFETV